MYYPVEILFNINDSYNPVMNVDRKNCVSRYSQAYISTILDNWKEGMIFEDYCNEPAKMHPKDQVIVYIVDIFNDYHRVWLLIDTDTYEKSEYILAEWALDYINDHMKEHWLRDRMKDLKTWHITLMNNESDDSERYSKYFIECCEEVNQYYIDEIFTMIYGAYYHIPTKLSHVMSAWENIDDETPNIIELLIKADDATGAIEIAADFIRLYLEEQDDEHESINDPQLE